MYFLSKIFQIMNTGTNFPVLDYIVVLKVQDNPFHNNPLKISSVS